MESKPIEGLRVMAKILLIEDNYELLRLYAKYLQASHHIIQPSMTAEAALDVFGQAKFDLIISDLRLGSFSIERLIRRLKRVNEEGTPVLVISAHLDIYEEVCHAHGLHQMLAKPIDKQAMVDKVKLILDGAKATKNSARVIAVDFSKEDKSQLVIQSNGASVSDKVDDTLAITGLAEAARIAPNDTPSDSTEPTSDSAEEDEDNP
jgi:DNA-binding NtrC family response regulator